MGLNFLSRSWFLSRFWVKAEEISILRSARGKLIALNNFMNFLNTYILLSKVRKFKIFNVDFIFCEKFLTVDQSTEDDDKNHTRILRPGGFKSTKSNCFDRI